MTAELLALTLFIATGAHGVAEPTSGTVGTYRMLTTTLNVPPPLTRVEVLCGPSEEVDGVPHRWWQLIGHVSDKRRFAIQLLSSRFPLSAEHPGEVRVARFRLEHDGRLEYRNQHTGRALLPNFIGFLEHFLPRAVAHCGRVTGMPKTARYLGHVLSLSEVRTGVPWPDWKDTIVLDLDPELLVGTGRNFKDTEGQRIRKDKDYTYVPFVENDYNEMIEAGINLFTVAPDQKQWVRDRPVFHVMRFSSPDQFDYPGDLYRSNYRGATQYLNEPTILVMSDPQLKGNIHHFSDAAALIEHRVRERYNSDGGNCGSYDLERLLRTIGCNLGAMRIRTHDYPTWETVFETAFYQMKGGCNGIVHEGRYRLKGPRPHWEKFDEAFERFTGDRRQLSARDLVRYHCAFLRGGTRPFGKFWGTSIYGQCDPDIAREAVTLAYDMGARYIWFWTSDRAHHVPYPEQLALARRIKAHRLAHPRPSIMGPPRTLDTAIVIPYPYFISIWNLDWIGELDAERKNESSRRYHALMRNALTEIRGCLDRNEDFDVVVDSGPDPGQYEITGYRRLVRISDATDGQCADGDRGSIEASDKGE